MSSDVPDHIAFGCLQLGLVLKTLGVEDRGMLLSSPITSCIVANLFRRPPECTWDPSDRLMVVEACCYAMGFM